MEHSKPPPEGENAGGLVAAGRRFLAACALWASTRLRLISIEGRDAGMRVAKLVALAVATVFLAILGWVFVCIAIVYSLAAAFGGEHGVVWAALIVAAMHFAGVAALVALLMRCKTADLFPLTIEELRKDQAWLEQEKEKA